MRFIEVKITTSAEGIEPVSGLLLMQGVTGYAIEDKQDFAEFLNDKSVYWDYIEDDLLDHFQKCETKITFYAADNAQGHETVEDVKNALAKLLESDKEKKFGKLSTELKYVEDEDWANNWKKHFKPFSVGKNLIIKPTWETLPRGNEKIVLEIDPESSFGTGSHMTTRLCLEAIEQYIEKIPVYEMLDVGCGSVILGIAASKLSSCNVTAVDIDENSVRIAGENAKINNIDPDRYTIYLGDLLSNKKLSDKLCEKQYDLIAANIVADVIILMAPFFKKALSQKGILIVSGILAERAKEVQNALLEEGFMQSDFFEEDGWACIVLKKTPDCE